MSRRFARAFAVVRLVLLVGSSIGSHQVRAHDQTATPVAAGTTTLESMLRYAPDILSGTKLPQVQVATFADAEAQLAAVGVSPIETMGNDDATRDWLRAVNWLLYPDFITARNAEWRAVFGFDLLQVDQALTLGEPPSQIAIMRGRFDPTAIGTALTTAGYQPIDSTDAPIYSLSAEPTVDFDSEVGRLALARMNNVALLPSDGILIAAPSLNLVNQVIATATGQAPSLADRPEIASLLAAQREPLASAMLVVGTALSGMPFDPTSLLGGTPVNVDEISTRVAETSAMPPIALALLGTTPGGPLANLGGSSDPSETPTAGIPIAHFDVNLLMLDVASATIAVEVATYRLGAASSLATNRPLTDYFADWSGEVVEGTTVAHLEIQFADGVTTGIWIQMLYQRDLVFLAW